MFFHSQSTPEQQHIIKALRFELGKVETLEVRERMVLHLAQIDRGLASLVAKGIGLTVPGRATAPSNASVPADEPPGSRDHRPLADPELVSPALSMAQYAPGPIATRRVAILVAEGFDGAAVSAVVKGLAKEGATGHLVGPDLNLLASHQGKAMSPEFSLLTTASVLFDAVYVAGGARAVEWSDDPGRRESRRVRVHTCCDRPSPPRRSPCGRRTGRSHHDMAEDTIELIRQLQIDSAVIVGYSDGGIIGLDIAIHHPEHVTRLALTGVNARIDGYTVENQEWARTFDPDDQPISEAYGRLSPDGPDHWPIVLERLKRMWIAEPSFTNEDLQRIKAPTLIIVGDGDIVTPEHAVEMFRSIPSTQLCVVPHVGHGVMPKEMVLAFLEEAGAADR
jgi:pimeloyl-ACP methyl ester carboxylesterase